MFGSLFSNKSSSTTAATSTVLNPVKGNVDTTISGDGSFSNLESSILGDNNSTSLNILDGGAIKGAYDFSTKTIADALDLSKEAFRQLGNAGQRETETAMNSINNAALTSNSDAVISKDLIKYGAYAVAALLIVYVVMKRGK